VGFTASDLGRVLRVFAESGVDFVVIGDTVVQLALKRSVLEGDVDLFVIEPGVVGNEEFYRELAERYGWGYGSTEVGTPRIVARVGSAEIFVELYENFMDIEIPPEILGKARTIVLEGVRVKLLHPEQYFVLKARQGVDLDKLAEYLKDLGKLDYKLLRETISMYPEDERELIVERLESIGLKP